MDVVPARYIHFFNNINEYYIYVYKSKDKHHNGRYHCAPLRRDSQAQG